MSVKGQGHSLTLAKGHLDFKIKTCFFFCLFVCLFVLFFCQKQLGHFMKPYGRMGIKIYTNDSGHMTKMAVMPIYGKKLKKSSSPEPTMDFEFGI